MRVNHRRADIPVPKELLNRPDVRPVLQQMRRKRMTERMAGRAFGDLRRGNGAAKRTLHHRLVEVMAPPNS